MFVTQPCGWVSVQREISSEYGKNHTLGLDRSPLVGNSGHVYYSLGAVSLRARSKRSRGSRKFDGSMPTEESHLIGVKISLYGNRQGFAMNIIMTIFLGGRVNCL